MAKTRKTELDIDVDLKTEEIRPETVEDIQKAHEQEKEKKHEVQDKDKRNRKKKKTKSEDRPENKPEMTEVQYSMNTVET